MRPLLRRFERLPPPAFLALVYLCLILAGTLLLLLPIAHAGEVGPLDAFFTATSAVTVTGLVVVDTGSAFTVFGQAVIALLIQLGGLGLMTFAALLLVSLGVSIGMPTRVILSEELGQTSVTALLRLSKLILGFALLAEAIATAILMIRFVPLHGFWDGLWHSIFHAVSALNNAGFSTFPDSLMSHVSDPAVTLTIALLFILGGLGFVVLGDIWQKRRWSKLSLHSRLMIVGSLVLLLGGWLVIAVLEWDNPGTLGGLDGAGARLLAAFFESATTRTAGFNSLDTSALENDTTLVVMALMFIGGGSTSTAGGIKVTTAIVLVLATIAFFKRRDRLHVFGRSLGLDEVLKVMALVTISLALIFAALFLTAITWKGDMLDLTFEVVSAFGTVGLSRGATGELDTFGRLVICAVMFLGRVGPLTLGFFLATRSQARVAYPKGQVYLG